ncbi:hypothetical protein QBC41DRAFT_398568 [Cercophora samala]|uniref:Uncharacterized protein n=1 Tax=Cercophora samala TaxID=330535 RepID=A0AA39Z8R6_9PEZI|nr:hypothetical protein QBC41DRAFT_398568 [Cercophora samala]
MLWQVRCRFSSILTGRTGGLPHPPHPAHPAHPAHPPPAPSSHPPPRHRAVHQPWHTNMAWTTQRPGQAFYTSDIPRPQHARRANIWFLLIARRYGRRPRTARDWPGGGLLSPDSSKARARRVAPTATAPAPHRSVHQSCCSISPAGLWRVRLQSGGFSYKQPRIEAFTSTPALPDRRQLPPTSTGPRTSWLRYEDINKNDR